MLWFVFSGIYITLIVAAVALSVMALHDLQHGWRLNETTGVDQDEPATKG